ncbi:cytochrome c oxidase subunit II [Pararhizobium sp. IMCC21322]|uniref:cytochrome c oxidase subunit II n=1 Tax=Pararhizobium sp. IMCC21322 TaxID=3067903 RepID=UPI002740FCE8|nr:cytochrome c oxidase subunit II [Pararhizobium sp. IMCC21322]
MMKLKRSASALSEFSKRPATVLFGGAAASLGLGSVAFAAQPTPWQISFQEAAAPVMEQINSFNTFTLWIVTPIVLFVLGLLIICAVRFNSKANPTPSKTTHNSMIEIVWTVAPVLILVVMAVPSFRLLYNQLEIPEAHMTIKATGYQWYWGYEYPDNDDISFDSYMLQEDELGPDDPRLLAVDNEIVVPVGKVVRVQVTAADVLHSFAMPSMGLKMDAVPGRLNETWFEAEREGIYYGQCSELCGVLHAFMPIAIRVVSDEQFAQWAQMAVEDVEGANEMLAGLLDEQRKLAQR